MTTVTPKRLDGLFAVSGTQPGVLGFVVWYSIPNESVSIRRLRQCWGAAGLDPSPLPTDRKATAVFRSVMGGLEGRQRDDDGTITQTDVVEVVREGGEIVYQVSRVVKDVQERIVDYPKALRVIYMESSGEIVYRTLGEVPKSELLGLMERITDEYERNAKQLPGRSVRAIVRDFIREEPDAKAHTMGLAGENLRGKSGGVYFIPAQYEDELDRLAGCLDELYSEHRAYLYSIPLADGAGERELIRRHHVANTVQEIKEAMGAAREVLRDDRERSIRSDTAQFHWKRLQKVQQRAQRYREILQDEQEEVEQAVEMLQTQLGKLL